MSPHTSQHSFSFRPLRAAIALTTLALLATVAPAAHTQNYFDTDGQAIGLVGGESYVGSINTKPFTVYTNVATRTYGPVGAYNHSTLEVNGGLIGDNLYARDFSTVNMRGGSVAIGVYASGGTFNMSGGSVGVSIPDDIYCYGDAVVNITGGTFFGALVAKDDGVLSVFGTSLSKTLLDANYDIGDNLGYVYSEYSLTGFLQDGTDISGKIALVRNDSGTFNLVNAAAVPESGSLAVGVIMAGSMLGLLARKRKA